MGSKLADTLNKSQSSYNDINTLMKRVDDGDATAIDDLTKALAVASIVTTTLGILSASVTNKTTRSYIVVHEMQLNAAIASSSMALARLNYQQNNYSAAIANSFSAVSAALASMAGVHSLQNGIKHQFAAATYTIASSVAAFASMIASNGEEIASDLIDAIDNLKNYMSEISESIPGIIEDNIPLDWENFKGFAGELLEDWSRWVYDWFPDSWNPWKNLGRDGKYHQYDPLVLDLDGDGIETVAASGFSGSLFDHDNDGIRTATGWVQSDDGLLVFDRNNDGIINNSSELFGDNTQLANGQNAAHGYEALAELDSNADGKISADDVAFSLLKVWRDLNQDGKRFSCNNMIIFGF